MKTVQISTNDPNVLGHHFKEKFFQDFLFSRQVQDHVRKAPNIYDEIEEVVWECYKSDISDLPIMLYYQDGDMTLRFVFEDGNILENTDAKKSYGWKWLGDISIQNLKSRH